MDLLAVHLAPAGSEEDAVANIFLPTLMTEGETPCWHGIDMLHFHILSSNACP
jgi:hypothetical protein